MPKEPSKRKQSRIPGVKRPKSGYTFFCNEKWSDVKKHILRQQPPAAENTKLQCAIMKELSVRWQKMSDKSRQRYAKKAQEDSKRYREQKEAYMKTQPPKKPRNNPYIYFFREMQTQIRERHPEMKQSQIAQEVASLWPGVKGDPEQVRKYENCFHRDLQDYNRQIERLAQ